MVENRSLILVVDDDPEDRLLLQDAFDELDHGDKVHYVEDGEKAILFLVECLKQDCIPHLVVLDLNMPRLNGRKTLEWIKSQSPLQHIPVVIYSTSLNPIEKEECLALGAYSYVVKPISYKESITIAENFLALATINHNNS